MITVEDVKTWLHLAADDTSDDALLGEVVDATNAWVAATAYVKELPDPAVWPADVTQGAVMLAARLYRRRNTPGGIDALADQAVYVPRRDADVDSLLHQAAFAPPRVG